MATKVFVEEDIELQDGSTALIRPLTIKNLKMFMEVIKNFDDDKDDEENLPVMLRAVAIAVSKSRPDLVPQAKLALREDFDTDALEDILDVPTIWRILELAGGVTNNPNPNGPRE